LTGVLKFRGPSDAMKIFKKHTHTRRPNCMRVAYLTQSAV